MYDWYPKQWWKDVDESIIKCTAEQIENFLDKVLTLRRYPETDDVSATTQAGIVSTLWPYMSLLHTPTHIVCGQKPCKSMAPYTNIILWETL